MLTVSSCGNESDTDSNDADGKQQVQITLTLNMASASENHSRAIAWSETDKYDTEAATSYENTIAEGKLQVLVFSTDGTYLDKLDDLTYYRRSTDSNVYEVVGTLKVDNDYITNNTLSCKLVVLANCNTVSMSKSNTLSDLSSLTFTYNDPATYSSSSSSPSYIPMFGVQTYTDLKMFAGYRVDAGEIDMLRSMAKIRVKLNLDSNSNNNTDTGEEIAFTSVTLTNYNTMGYVVPVGFAGVNETKKLTIVDTSAWDWVKDNTFNPCNNYSKETLSLLKTSDTEYYIYVPEYRIADGGRPTFTVKFDFQLDDDTNTFTFDFNEYAVNTGEVTSTAQRNTNYNIERNCVYNFTIKKTKGKILITTGDWNDVFDNTIDFKK